MTSNFSFLREYWPDLCSLAELAESYLYTDPNACVVKIGMLGESIVQKIFSEEELIMPEDNRQVVLINLLRQADLLPENIDNILYAIRKSRNEAAHAGMDSFEKAKTLLHMAYNLCGWFMEVYGDWNYRQKDYVEPEAPADRESILEMIQEQEKRIQDLSERIETINHRTDESAEERKERSDSVSKEIHLTTQEVVMLEKEKIRFEMLSLEVFNYAIQQNGIPLISKFIVFNDSDNVINNIDIKISSNPASLIETTKKVDNIPAHTGMEIKDLKPDINSDFLLSLSEKMTCQMVVELIVDGDTCYKETADVTVLTYDQWNGVRYFPELLASFVLPNYPDIVGITARASDLMRKWGKDPSFDAYQTQDPDRVLSMAAAIYAAIQEQNIIYTMPPAGLINVGQRVRLCDTVLKQKQGTCLDLTLLYAACLESVGLNPLLILKKDHIFAGVWLDDITFSEVVQSDISKITLRIAEGFSEIEVIECTAMVAGKNTSFNEAVHNARAQLLEPDLFEYVIDVKRARLSNINPLPVRIIENGSIRIERENVDISNIHNIPNSPVKRVDVNDTGLSDTLTKKQIWERKLLDFGMRNTLINLRLSRSIIPIIVSSLDELEDRLSDGADYTIQPRPEVWHIPYTKMDFDNMHDLGNYTKMIQGEFKQKRLRSSLNDSDLSKRIKTLYRSAKASIEENGANTLYLALGLLKWYETDKSQKARYAPIVLLPVDLVRKFGNQGYVIRLRDEEPHVNITIFEKLKQDFNITITGLEPIPTDEHGIDIRQVFTIVRRGILGKQRWDVLESAYLGIFSFSQFVLWNDIRNRYDDLEKNKVVKSLMTGKLEWNCLPMTIGDHVSEDGAFMPVPADASQLFAIESAAKGESFVLHGPPGTGKSQTITALIANALANKKTVLFIAEKMAALEVVQKRLSQIGLGSFCLEIHSNKSNKKNVLEQLRQASEVTKGTVAEEYERKSVSIQKLREELDIYKKELHKRQSCGLSLYEMICEYEENITARNISRTTFLKYDISSKDILEDQLMLVEQMVRAGMAVGHPHNNKLSCVKNTTYTQLMRLNANECIRDYKEAIDGILNADRGFSRIIHENDAEDITQAKRHAEIAEAMEAWNELPAIWATVEELTGLLESIKDMANHYIEANNTFYTLSGKWNKEFFEGNASAVLNEYSVAEGKWFIPRLIDVSRINKRLLSYQKGMVGKEHLKEELSTLQQYQEEKSYADSLYEKHSNYLVGLITEKSNEEMENLICLADKAIAAGNRLDSCSGNRIVRTEYYSKQVPLSIYQDLKNSLGELENAKGNFEACFDIDQAIDRNNTWFDQQKKNCDFINDNILMLREWTNWNAICEKAKEKGLSDVIDAYNYGIAHEEIIPAYKKAVSYALALKTIADSQTLNNFSGAIFNEKIIQFKRLDEEIMKLSQEEIFCKLAARVPDFTREAGNNSELGILQRAIRSGGRGISIRKLFEQLPTLLTRLCPCLLMSPLSAAQYLDTRRTPFDIVVFDEASQLQTCKAVGALARGKDAVIVGDPNQMPPTSFFKTNSVDEDNLESEDLESILDDCLALNMPETHLLWHYRSRHESLIAFSNNQFYDNKLLTFPSVNDRETKVSLVHVDGTFDRGKSKTNEIEANAVVDEVLRRFHDKEKQKQSIGIVTFNISQQNLIDDKLSEACITEEGLEDWIYNSPEPMFIKNLESVQGDERDVILFSIGYGPNSEGNIYMNFGPLNRDGGWRRLNVAVSRARDEMIVFSSMYPDQINLSKTKAEGVAALKHFLEYANGGQLTLNEKSSRSKYMVHDGIVDAISNRLKQKGYKIDKQIGHSEYRIDIGVVDKEDPGKYILGILLDGNSYKEAKTTRDRELAQINVLNGLGWSIVRIWTMDWFENSDKEFDRILNELQRAESNKKIEPNNTTSVDKTVERKRPFENRKYASSPIVQKKPSQKYTTYSAINVNTIWFRDDLSVSTYYFNPRIEDVIRKILLKEAPITETLLNRRIAQINGIGKVGSRIRSNLSYIYYRLNLKKTTVNNVNVYWNEDQDPDNYREFRVNGEDENKRDIKDIPIQELGNAICEALFDLGKASKGTLSKEGAKTIGFNRMGQSVASYMDIAIDYVSKVGRIQMDRDGDYKLSDKELQSR